ncbi:hypothetical protein [Streptomyces sp. 3214.6]|uniref:hypothetical protein n=1 Tax=Streptomyces sp. 3214.6 TaxID=1882757 RepID=UPI0009A697EB|nr:hypothetical protein [Streptomyces sp. 3214.6]
MCTSSRTRWPKRSPRPAGTVTDPPGVRAWERHTTSTLRVHELPGGHFFTNERAEDVADILREVMTNEWALDARP